MIFNCPKMLRFSMLKGLDAPGVNHRSRCMLWSLDNCSKSRLSSSRCRKEDRVRTGNLRDLDLVQKTWSLDLCLMDLALAIFFSFSLF